MKCGDVVFGQLDGGSTTYDYDYWLMVGELGSHLGDYTAFDGAERVYLFDDDTVVNGVTATFETCFDGWETWILYGDVSGPYCSTASYETAGIFEDGGGNTWSTTRIASGDEYDFEFIVEGLDGATGNYELTIECF